MLPKYNFYYKYKLSTPEMRRTMQQNQIDGMFSVDGLKLTTVTLDVDKV